MTRTSKKAEKARYYTATVVVKETPSLYGHPKWYSEEAIVEMLEGLPAYPTLTIIAVKNVKRGKA